MAKEKEMKLKITNLDEEKTDKSPWNLYYSITTLQDTLLTIRVINFRANSPEEALKKSLNLLKASARRISPHRKYSQVTLMGGKWHPFAPVQPEKLFQLKWKYKTRKVILEKITQQNLKEYFVQGYGPEALKQLQEGL